MQSSDEGMPDYLALLVAYSVHYRSGIVTSLVLYDYVCLEQCAIIGGKRRVVFSNQALRIRPFPI